MTLLPLPPLRTGMLNLGWGAEFAAALAYAHATFSKRGGGSGLARVLLGVAWLSLGALLATSWRASGLWQPPWLALPETMLFGAWCLCGAQLYAELGLGARVSGFLSAAIAAAASGVTLFALGGADSGAKAMAAEPLYRNPWVWVHLPSGLLGYALIFLAAAFAALALARTDGKSDSLLALLAAMALVSLGGRAQAFAGGYEGAMAGFAAYLALWAFARWLETHDRRVRAAIASSKPELAAGAAHPSSRAGLKRLGRLIFAAAWAAYLGTFYGSHPGAAPLGFVWRVLLGVLSGAALAAVFRPKRMEKRLPAPEELDQWSHEAALFAFPLLTLHLVSGSMWSYDAWGSYWSWQPQQGWVFVAWLYLALLLHLERGKVGTWVATIGGLIVVAAAIAAGAHGFWPARS